VPKAAIPGHPTIKKNKQQQKRNNMTHHEGYHAIFASDTQPATEHRRIVDIARRAKVLPKNLC